MCPWLFSGERGGCEVFDPRGVGSADEALICERSKIICSARALIEHLNRDTTSSRLTESNASANHALEEHGTEPRVQGEEQVASEACSAIEEGRENSQVEA